MSWKIFSNQKNIVTSRRVNVVALGMLLIAALVILINTNPWLHNQWELTTTEQPERLTELYFSNPNSLPGRIAAGTPYVIHYDIHNDEGTSTKYIVDVSEAVNGQAGAVQQHIFVLPAGASVNLPATIMAIAKGQTLQVTVSLPLQNESIYFRSQS